MLRGVVSWHAADPPSAQEVLWRVNTEEFNRRFRNKVRAPACLFDVLTYLQAVVVCRRAGRRCGSMLLWGLPLAPLPGD